MSESPDLHTIEAYPIDFIKERPVPWEIPNCPLSSEARRMLLAECPVIVDMSAIYAGEREIDIPLPFTPPREIDGYDAQTVSLRQPSRDHNRSFELRGKDFTQPWADEYGNYYRAFTLKGNNFSNPGVMEHPTAIDQYVAWGLQESKIIERVLKASDLLRERGVSTEYIVGLAEPQTYPYTLLDGNVSAYDLLPLSEYRRRIVERYWKTLPGNQQTFDSLVDVQSKFNDMTFYISMRAMDTAYRFGDIIHGPSARRQEVFDAINEQWLLPDEEALYATKRTDINRYIQKYLAPNLAINLARMHVDLAHGFLHKLNITAFGGIVDVDSVHGEPIGFGDKPITDENRAGDFLQAAHEIFEATFPGSFLKNVQKEALEEFSLNYIAETNSVLGSFDMARRRIGQMISILDDVVSQNPQSNIYAAINSALKDAYMLMYFIHDPEFKAQNDAFGEFLQEFVPAMQYFDGLISDKLLANNKEEFLSEFLNELQDGEHDIKRLLSSPRNPVKAAIESEVLAQLKEIIYPIWGNLAEQHMLQLLDGVELTTAESIYHAHCDIHYARFKELADSIVPDLIASSLARIEKSLMITQAIPSFEGSTFYYDGREDGFLWALTQDVPVADVADFMDIHELNVRSMNITCNPQVNVGFIEITDGNKVYEIVTNAYVDATQYTNEHLRIDISPQATRSEPLYAFVIKLEENGERSYELHMVPEQRETIEAAEQQEFLF